MVHIKFTVYMLPRAWQRAGIATRDRNGNPLARPHSFTQDQTAAAKADIRAQAYNHRPRGPVPTGPVFLDMTVFRPWTAKEWAKAQKMGRHTNPIENVKGDGRLGPIDSLPGSGPWPKSKPDNDNYEKLVFDALPGLFYKDDALIVKNSTEKLYSNVPRFEITISYPESN